MTNSLISLSSQVETSTRAIQGAQYLCDLQVTGTEPDKKIITLQRYATIPLLGRLIGYFRSLCCDTQSISREIEKFSQFHEKNFKDRLDQFVQRHGEDEDFKNIYEYHQKVSQLSYDLFKFNVHISINRSFAQTVKNRFEPLIHAD